MIWSTVHLFRLRLQLVEDVSSKLGGCNGCSLKDSGFRIRHSFDVYRKSQLAVLLR